MKLVVLATDDSRKEMLEQGLKEGVHVEWIQQVEDFTAQKNADGYIQLLNNLAEKVILILTQLKQLVIFSSMMMPVAQVPLHFVRINGWNTFLKRPVVEASCGDENLKNQSEEIFAAFNKKVAWTPDIPGFISSRVIAMIINEAYFALA